MFLNGIKGRQSMTHIGKPWNNSFKTWITIPLLNIVAKYTHYTYIITFNCPSNTYIQVMIYIQTNSNWWYGKDILHKHKTKNGQIGCCATYEMSTFLWQWPKSLHSIYFRHYFLISNENQMNALLKNVTSRV